MVGYTCIERTIWMALQNESDTNLLKEEKEVFILNDQPDQFKLSRLPNQIIDWIEDQGFDFITICDKDGEIVYVSGSIKGILGYQNNDLIGKKTKSYLKIKDREWFTKKFNNDTVNLQSFSLQVRGKTGKYIWVDTVIKPIYIRDSDKKFYISLVNNITDKKEAEEMLIRSEKMSVAGQLAAGVAHEIRNPLTSIKGFIDLLQAGMDRKDEYYKIMVEEIDKIESISSELLFISKPLTDKRSDQLVKDMLEDVITLLNTQAKTYNIQLDLQIVNDCTVYCDRSQLKQVFINLIKNAIEEMADGGIITIKVNSDVKEQCIISVIDQGSGVPEHLIHKIKEPFFTTKKEGTGLGLMISNKIINNHNGDFVIKRNEDCGSTFEVHLPLVTHSVNYHTNNK